MKKNQSIPVLISTPTLYYFSIHCTQNFFISQYFGQYCAKQTFVWKPNKKSINHFLMYFYLIYCLIQFCNIYDQNERNEIKFFNLRMSSTFLIYFGQFILSNIRLNKYRLKSRKFHSSLVKIKEENCLDMQYFVDNK